MSETPRHRCKEDHQGRELSVRYMNDLSVLKAQIAVGHVTFRVNGVDERGAVTHWVEVDATPVATGIEWNVRMTFGNGVERLRSFPSEIIEEALTKLMLTIRNQFVQRCPHGVS